MTHVNGRRVYLSGPMTGIEGWNKPAFDGAEKQLRKLNIHDVYNPADHIDSHSIASHCVAMQLSLNELTSTKPWYDLLVSLPGWKQSAGARLEREVAEACGIEVCNLDEVVE